MEVDHSANELQFPARNRPSAISRADYGNCTCVHARPMWRAGHPRKCALLSAGISERQHREAPDRRFWHPEGTQTVSIRPSLQRRSRTSSTGHEEEDTSPGRRLFFSRKEQFSGDLAEFVTTQKLEPFDLIVTAPTGHPELLKSTLGLSPRPIRKQYIVTIASRSAYPGRVTVASLSSKE
jgi:hypothetical protein